MVGIALQREGMSMSQSGDVTASGENSQAAGRDINIYSLPSGTLDLKDEFEKLDKLAAEAIGSMTSPRSVREDIEFSSEKLFNSLSQVGIPPQVILLILRDIVPYIEQEIEESGERFSTKHVRIAVTKTILGIELLNIDREERLRWGSRYARKFGNPDRQIMILNQDGTLEKLNYRFLNREFLPHLIRRILGFDFNPNEEHKIISNIAIRDMSEQILMHVRRMDLYNIRYQTLLSLAEDLAIQPPHPWFITPNDMDNTVNYDMERAYEHLERILDAECGSNAFWQMAGECVHHLCSAIQGNYGSFLGCSYLAPLHNLRMTLQIVSTDDNLALWNFCKIKQIDADLRAIDSNISELSSMLKRMEKLLGARRSTSYTSAQDLCRRLYEYARHLIEERRRFFGLISQLEEGSFAALSNGDRFRELLFRINGAILLEKNDSSRLSRIKISQGTELASFVKPIVFFACQNENESESEFLKQIELDVSKNKSRHADAIFAVMKDEEKLLTEIRPHTLEGLNVYFLGLSDFLDVVISDNSQEKLASIIIE